MPESEMPQDFSTPPCDVISWGKGKTYEDLLLVRPIDPGPEDDFMMQTPINTSVLHRRIQDVLAKSEAFLTEGKYGACHAGINWLSGMLWVVKELKYLTDLESKPYYDKMKELRDQAIMYEDNGV